MVRTAYKGQNHICKSIYLLFWKLRTQFYKMTLIRRYKNSAEHKEPSRHVDERLIKLETDIQEDELGFRGSILFDDFVNARLRGRSKAALKETRDNLAFLELMITSEKELFKIVAPFVAFFYFFFQFRNLLVTFKLGRLLDHENYWTAMMWSILRLLTILGALRVVFLAGARIINWFMSWDVIADAEVHKSNTNTVVSRLELDAGLGFDCID